jgi:hypothetical protein
MTSFWLAVRLGRENSINAKDSQVGKMLSCYYAPGSAYSLIDSRHQDMTLWVLQLWPVHCNKRRKVTKTTYTIVTIQKLNKP